MLDSFNITVYSVKCEVGGVGSLSYIPKPTWSTVYVDFNNECKKRYQYVELFSHMRTSKNKQRTR